MFSDRVCYNLVDWFFRIGTTSFCPGVDSNSILERLEALASEELVCVGLLVACRDRGSELQQFLVFLF